MIKTLNARMRPDRRDAPWPALRSRCPARAQTAAAPCEAAHGGRRRGVARRRHAHGAQDHGHARRDGLGREGRPDPVREGLRLRGHGEAHAGRCAHHALPSGLGLEALHLDRGDAAGRSRQARPRRRREQVPRLPDPGLRRQADHAAQHHDAPHRLRGGGEGPHHLHGRGTHGRADGEEVHPAADLSAGNDRRAIPTTRPRSPATSCSASPASRSRTTSSATSSCRSA